MNANINSVVVTLSDGTSKKIEVKNGMILILMGNGPMDGAFWKKLEEATEVELNAAEGEIIEEEQPVPFDEKLKAVNEELQNSPEYSYFNSAVEYLLDMAADEFLEVVRYAEEHGNRFPRFIGELKNVINANDAWGSAFTKLISVYNKDMQDKLHRLLGRCLGEDVDGCDEDMFLASWDDARSALSTFNVL